MNVQISQGQGASDGESAGTVEGRGVLVGGFAAEMAEAIATAESSTF